MPFFFQINLELMSCCWGWVGMTEWYGLDMCGDGHGGLGEWLVKCGRKSYKHHIHAAKMLKLYNK
jgi:hypothetical protein